MLRMNKDVPVICPECEHFRGFQNGTMLCERTGKTLYASKRPSWCPLPPLWEEVTPLEEMLLQKGEQ